MPIRSGDTAPYAPPATVLQVINAFRDRGLATPITAEVLLRASVNDSLVPRTLKSFQGLELIDDQGNPTDALEGLRRASSDEFRQRLEAVVRGVYAEVFQFADPAKDDATRVADAFRAYEPIGQRGRMVTLFLGLCQAAGIIAESTRRPTATGTTKPPTRRATERTTQSRRPSSVSHNADVRNVDGGFIPKPLLGLLAGMPTAEEGWTQTYRDRFVETFKSVLDFCIPISDGPEALGHYQKGPVEQKE